ncbi:hypothetical protein AB0P37_36255 [Streptomyces antimycoticus]|uniref:hypothetical protein n=1 Tax=Streptomyces antimycoticus TaxID=68175 RepID=UPI003448CBD0
MTDADGIVSGARALDRTTGETVRIEAGAVVLAAGAARSSPRRSAATSTPGTARCWPSRRGRGCPGWSSPTPTPSPPRARR